MISEDSCEKWKSSFAITGINYIVKYFYNLKYLYFYKYCLTVFFYQINAASESVTALFLKTFYF